jgi:type I restriction enzyme S subunit
MSFRLPGAPEKQAIARPLRSLQDRIWNNVDESRTLAALRDLLLPRLLSGELRVRDAEREVGRVA